MKLYSGQKISLHSVTATVTVTVVTILLASGLLFPGFPCDYFKL